VEDVSLGFKAFKGLPGNLIKYYRTIHVNYLSETRKYFLKNLGLDGLNKLLEGFPDKTAYAQCIFGYAENAHSEVKLFIGKTKVSWLNDL